MHLQTAAFGPLVALRTEHAAEKSSTVSLLLSPLRVLSLIHEV